MLVRFIIHTELQQVRYYALLGDEAALQPSPVLIPRYFVNPLCQAREALLHSVEPPHSCPAETLQRFEEGLDTFTNGLTPHALKTGDLRPGWQVPPPPLPPPPPHTLTRLCPFAGD